ncbi:MAG: PhnD/SsuA/transferrin family substrate-binding protein [Nitrospinota bacterium]
MSRAISLSITVLLSISLITIGSINHAIAGSTAGIKIAVTAAFVSANGMPVYDKIAKYVAQKIGISTRLVSGFSYDEVDDILDKGLVQVGFVCGLPYTKKFEQGKVELLVAPVMADPRYGDKPIYFSDVIVHKDSSIKSFADLKDKIYAYNEKASNSGYNLPRWRLLQVKKELGLPLGSKFFGRIISSGAHEESIRLVANKTVDASSVDSLVLDFDREFFPKYASQVKVIESIGPAGVVPVVIATEALKNDPTLKKRLQDAFAGMSADPEGRKILKESLIKRFVVVDDSNYDDIRKMEKEALSAGLPDLN